MIQTKCLEGNSAGPLKKNIKNVLINYVQFGH